MDDLYRSRLSTLAIAHASLAVSGIVILLFGIQIAFASRASVTTARAIITESSPFTVLLGVVINQLPLLVILTFLAAQYYLRVHKSWLLLGTLLMLPIMPIVGWITALAWIVWFIPKGTIRIRRSTWPRSETDITGLWFAAMGVFYIWLIPATNSAIWLPSEAIATDGETVIGYVLSNSDDAMVVLRDSDRQVLRIVRETVDSRQYCVLSNSTLSRTIPSLIGRRERPQYPRCGSFD